MEKLNKFKMENENLKKTLNKITDSKLYKSQKEDNKKFVKIFFDVLIYFCYKFHSDSEKAKEIMDKIKIVLEQKVTEKEISSEILEKLKSFSIERIGMIIQVSDYIENVKKLIIKSNHTFSFKVIGKSFTFVKYLFLETLD